MAKPPVRRTHPKTGVEYGTRGDKKVYNISEELLETDDAVNGLNGGVSVSWLMKAFRMGRSTIESKLIGCPSIGFGKHGVLLYDIPTVASYLVNPARDIAKYIEQADVKDLPERLREPFWNSKLKEQRYLEKAGELWPTHLVVEKIADILSDIRAMLTLIPDDLEREAGLNAVQRQKVKARIDKLQTGIYNHIMGLSSKTPSQRGQFLDEIIEEEGFAPAPEELVEPEVDDDDLIGGPTDKYEFI